MPKDNAHDGNRPRVTRFSDPAYHPPSVELTNTSSNARSSSSVETNSRNNNNMEGKDDRIDTHQVTGEDLGLSESPFTLAAQASQLKHTMTMGGHDNKPLGFKTRDIRRELMSKVTDEKELKDLSHFIDKMDADGDGTIT